MDWLNHETWKPIADLVTDWKTIGTLVIAVAAACWRWRKAMALARAQVSPRRGGESPDAICRRRISNVSHPGRLA
jgi:hypothetical protein